MKNIISLSHVNYTIPHCDTILGDVSFDIEQGEFYGILGQNGAGKTTLIDIILGFRQITGGKVNVLGEDPHSVNREHRDKIIFISQEVIFKTSLTIKEHLKFHSTFYPKYSIEVQDRLLGVFNLDVDSKIGSLSTGQQKKVQIVAGFSSRPQIILIDEITAVLDPTTRSIFFAELHKIRVETNCSILLATNIAEDLIHRAQKILFISKGNAKVHSPIEIQELFKISKDVA